MANSQKNIIKLAKMIETETKIKVTEKYISSFGGWGNIVFKELYSDDMIALGEFINKHFTRPGLFTHRCIRLVLNAQREMALSISEQILNEIMGE